MFFKVNKINIIIVNICMILKKLRELRFFMGKSEIFVIEKVLRMLWCWLNYCEYGFVFWNNFIEYELL